MTLPTSGALSLSDIAAELGDSQPYEMLDYYAGGGFVPVGAEGINGPIPSFGDPLKISDFYGYPIQDTINYGTYWEQGPVPNIYPTADRSTGYTLVYDNGELYGSVTTGEGSNESIEGWGVDGIGLWEEEGIVSDHGQSWWVSFTNTQDSSKRFRITVDPGGANERILDTNNADTDTITSVSYPGGSKNIRWCWWDTSPWDNNAFPFYNNNNWNIRVERLT